MRNFAFIDAQNLYLTIRKLGWKIDYKRFRKYLSDKYSIKKAYMFMGFIPENQDIYNMLQTMGYILIFKPVLEGKGDIIKGNCDAELVLQSMIDYNEYDKAVIVSGDGDFYCLAKYLDKQGKLLRVLAPSPTNCSSLLKNIVKHKIDFISFLRKKLEYSIKK